MADRSVSAPSKLGASQPMGALVEAPLPTSGYPAPRVIPRRSGRPETDAPARDGREDLRLVTKKLLFALLVGLRRTGGNMTRSLVWLALAHDDGGWSVSALAEATGLDRKSVRATLARFETDGFVIRGEDGWAFTRLGVEQRIVAFENFWNELPPLARNLICEGSASGPGGKTPHLRERCC
ncbi:MAG: hypothetical protein AAF661_15560 [Pseudomonadota bacterium]